MMELNSRLFHHERGNIRSRDVLPLREKIRARFDLPREAQRAEVFIAAQKQSASAPPLRACIAQAEYSFDAPHDGRVCWLRSKIEADNFSKIEIEIPIQDGWSLAHDATGAPVVRLRAWGDGLQDDRVLPMYGDAAISAQRDEWLALLPEDLRACDEKIQGRWDWCWRLAGWLSGAWPYANEFEAFSYAPWDARTILQWGRAGHDDSGEKPIVMCVHYAVCFIQFCIAQNIPARAIVLSPDLDSHYGHFVVEVWLEEFKSWAMIDPNLHLCFRDGSTLRPLSVGELYERRNELSSLAHCGESFAGLENRLQSFAREYCFSSTVYRLWGVWARHDWIGNPQCAPPAQGVVLYAETDILWCGDDETNKTELAMFPYFLLSSQLSQCPKP